MARDFPGSATNYLSLGAAPAGIDSITGGALTVHAIVQPDSVSPGAQIFSHDTSADRAWVLGITSSKLEVVIGDGGSGQDVATGATTLVTGKWYAMGLVKMNTGPSGTLDAYLNGVSDAQVTSQLSIGDSNAVCSIGARGGSANFFDGRIQECAIWAASLNSTEMAQLAAGKSPLTIQPTLLRGYWPLCGDQLPEPDLIGANPAILVGSVPAVPHGYVNSPYCQGPALSQATRHLGHGSAW